MLARELPGVMKWWCFRPLLCTLFRLNWAESFLWVPLGLSASCPSKYLLTQWRWAYVSIGMSIVLNTLRLVSNPNGSTVNCHCERSNVCRLDDMKQNIFHILGGKPLTLLQDHENWPRCLHYKEALTMHDIDRHDIEDTWYWYYSFQDPSRYFLTYEEGRYFLTIQISGRHFFLLMKRVNIFLRWQGLKYLFFIMIGLKYFVWQIWGLRYLFPKNTRPPPESQLVAPLCNVVIAMPSFVYNRLQHNHRSNSKSVLTKSTWDHNGSCLLWLYGNIVLF